MKDQKSSDKLVEYLKERGAKYDILEHRTVYTAIDAANTMKKKMDEIVKSLLVRAGKHYCLVCLPANQNLDFKRLKRAVENAIGVKVGVIEIPDEKTMQKILKVRDEGVSAFGGFYKLPVVVEKKLAKLKKAIFSSGGFNHSIEMAVRDFMKLENAVLDSFGVNKKIKLQKIIINPRRSSSLMEKGAKKNMAKKKKAAKKKTAKKKTAKKKTAKKKTAKKKTAKRKKR